MTNAAPRQRIIPLCPAEEEVALGAPQLTETTAERSDGPDPIPHPASLHAKPVEPESHTAPAAEIGFWNNVPVRNQLEDLRPNPLSWAMVQARRDRMKAYLPIIEVTTMLMLTLIGVLVEHLALMIFGDWK